MKKLFLLLISFLIISCQNDDDSSEPILNPITYNAKVLQKGNCGSSYLIQFNSNATNVPANSTQNIFYATNLPVAYNINELDIYVTFRLPFDEELMNCPANGFTYPQIYIESVQ